MTTTQRNLNEMVKQNLSINGSAKFATPVTVTIQSWNGYENADREVEINEVLRMGKAGVVHFTDQFTFLRVSELSDTACKALIEALQANTKKYILLEDRDFGRQMGPTFFALKDAIAYANILEKRGIRVQMWRDKNDGTHSRVIYK